MSNADADNTLSANEIAELQNGLALLAGDDQLENFYASHVIPRGSGIIGAKAHAYLGLLVERGDLDVCFDVHCPKTNEILSSYRLGEPTLIGQEIEDAEGGKFVLRDEHIFVRYSFTPQFSVRRLLGLPDGKLYRAWWKIRYAITLLVVGYPKSLLSGLRRGFAAFRRAFGEEWGDRWRLREADRAYSRFINVR